MAVEACMQNMGVGGIPAANATQLCSSDASTYMSPTSANTSQDLMGYGENGLDK
eukprot:CAMPEP_0181321426 /NCGR_PEP_ID=MMETSP1101-20121128/18676_1 /TAXON_ID=46948 /ORGANISM="Rhodomonas abbreviata, Strain Caron Lab Isolate" /LENGTH=53 /DNA_ID=CAMNT_0023429247 /DNA_START=90 /DNA_END=251 /DNA_ORIENTATION=+